MAGVVAELGLADVIRIVSALRFTVSPKRWYKLQQVAAQRRFDLTLVLENLSNPRNAAAIFRVCDALGIPEVHVISSLDTLGQTVAAGDDAVGSGPDAGAHRWLCVRHHEHPVRCVEHLEDCGFSVLASDLGEASLPLGALLSPTGRKTELSHPHTARLALVMGNEHRGTSRLLARRARHTWHLPQSGMVQSLNVSVAAGIALSHAASALDHRREADTTLMFEMETDRPLPTASSLQLPGMEGELSLTDLDVLQQLPKCLTETVSSESLERATGLVAALPARVYPQRWVDWPEPTNTGEASATARGRQQMMQRTGHSQEALRRAWQLMDQRAVVLTDEPRMRLLATWLLRMLSGNIRSVRDVALNDSRLGELLERV
jgi:tRNA (guanosine-2'-O-)-methyltransferase